MGGSQKEQVDGDGPAEKGRPGSENKEADGHQVWLESCYDPGRKQKCEACCYCSRCRPYRTCVLDASALPQERCPILHHQRQRPSWTARSQKSRFVRRADKCVKGRSERAGHTRKQHEGAVQ